MKSDKAERQALEPFYVIILKDNIAVGGLYVQGLSVSGIASRLVILQKNVQSQMIGGRGTWECSIKLVFEFDYPILANFLYSRLGHGTFDTVDTLTREQLATILYRYEQYLGGGSVGMWMFPLQYDDAADVAEWAYEAICWLTMKNIYITRVVCNARRNARI